MPNLELTLFSLEESLQRCLHEQERCRLQVQWDDSPTGPLLGLRDWLQEEKLVRGEIYRRFQLG